MENVRELKLKINSKLLIDFFEKSIFPNQQVLIKGGRGSLLDPDG